MSRHKTSAATSNHIVQSLVYADQTARLAATGFTSADIGRVALQQDTGQLYALTDDSPITWKEITSQGGGGGGGGEWRTGSAAAPVEATEYDQKVWKFQQGGGQSLYRLYKVPATYTPGVQIKLAINLYSPDTSGNVLLESLATLVRPGTDAANSTTNQHASTNSALTMDATANKLREAILDLTDATGNINGVAVQPGHEIRVELSRDAADTAASEARFVPDSTELRTT